MVLLTITKTTLEAIKFCKERKVEGLPLKLLSGEPNLECAELGGPIAHHQLIDLAKCLRNHPEYNVLTHKEESGKSLGLLQDMLKNSKVYIEPQKPKPEPTVEYRALMTQLREEEETRTYERMVATTERNEHAAGGISSSTGPRLFSGSNINGISTDEELTFTDVNRQVALIINVLLSIVGCSVAIWVAASHLSTPVRLALSMSGSGVVGIAEVIIYAGYIRRIKTAKQKEKRKTEVKEVIETWVIERSSPTGGELIKASDNSGQLRKRKTSPKPQH